MERVVEPKLMPNEAQVLAYANGDFSQPHTAFVDHFVRYFPDIRSDVAHRCLDVGCGPCDITVRMAQRFPKMEFTAIDGSRRMLAEGTLRVERESLINRITLEECQLPGLIPGGPYHNIISNSLLHHLHDPNILWETIKAAGTCGSRVLIMDLMRADSIEDARVKTETYCQGESEVLKQDYYNSLLAAFTFEEVLDMIKEHGLHGLRVDAVSDRHLIVHGRL
jgi:trans-aconitate methyltransferase